MRRHATCAFAALLLLAVGSCGKNVPASTTAPIKNPPQFILFTHDDEVSKWSASLVLPVANSARNPDKCPLPVTWFACTRACTFDCKQVLRLAKLGHEFASHTQNHTDLRTLKQNQIRLEITGAREDIIKCGIARGSVKGFRTPYLSDKPLVRQVLYNNGFRYDSTIGAAGGGNRVWPGTMNNPTRKNGIGFNCAAGGNQCARNESYPGMWQVPLYGTPSQNLMDYCTNESNGKPVKGCSAFAQLKAAFDAAYSGNRGPITVGIHSPYLSNTNYSKELIKFFRYAFGKKQQDVWAVTMNQFLDWMVSPVNATQMPKWIARYRKCK